MAFALELVRPEIYELLIVNGYKLEPHEDFDEIMKEVTTNMPETATENKDKLFEIHKKCAVASNHEYLIKLRSICQLHHVTPKELRCDYFWKVMTALKELDKIPEVSILLEIIAICPQLRIIFDFSRESVDHIDPKKNENVRGSTHPSAFCITIGAKLLLDKNERFEVYGTMAHEFCHYAMNLMFCNDCKPYVKDDEEKEKAFEKIVGDYSQREISEVIVALAFQNSFAKWHAELIVRVPHVLALYKGIDEKLDELRYEFNELFEFYEKLMSEMKQKIRKMKVELIVKETNEICGISSDLQSSKFNLKDDAIDKFKIDMELNNLLVYRSNCIDVTLKTIYEKSMKLEKHNFLIFAKIKSFKIEKIAKLIFTALESSNDVAVIVNCDEINQQKSKIIDEVCKKVTKNKKIVFVSNENPQIAEKECQEMNHLLSELTEESQKKLLMIKVNFQGTQLELNEIWSKNLESNESVPLDKLSRNEEIKIGEEIKFEEIHVERKFVAADAKWDWRNKKYDKEPVTVDEIITEIANSKVFVLSDAPGNGKSTEFKFFTSKLKENFKNCWILLIDLKKHTENFEKDSENSMNFNSVEEIANFLAEKILKLQGFEKDIFSELFKSDRVVVLMDGVDEISPSFKNFVMKLANGIRKMAKNQLWMATRPHLSQELEEKLETKAWKLTEFRKEDQVSLFEQIFEKKNEKYGEFRERIESFLNVIEKYRWIDKEKVTNPLLLYMIAKLFIDEPDIQLQSLNLYKVYDEFVAKMVRRLFTKGSEAEKDSVDFMRNINIQEFHRKIAVEKKCSRFGFDEHDIDIGFDKDIKFTNSCKNLPKPSNDQLARIGLMYNDGSDNYFFIHETFSEFFVAQTIVEKFFELKFQSKKELEEILEVLYKVLDDDDDDKVIMKFLHGALENFAIDQTSDKSKILINSLDHKSLNFWKAAKYGCNNLLITLSKLVVDNQKAMEIWMVRYGSDYGHTNILGIAFQYQTLVKIEKLWSFADKFFTEDQIKELFTDNKYYYGNCFSAALLNEDERVFGFLLQLADKKLSQSEKEEFINCKSLNWDRICWRQNLKLALNRIKKHLASEYKNYLIDLKENAFNVVCKYQENESVKFLCEEITENFGSDELKVILQRTYKKGRNVLMFAAKNTKDPEVFETLINFIEDKNKVRELLLQENEYGENVLMIALRWFSIEEYRKVLKAYEKYFSSEELKEIFTKRNETNKNVLDLAANKSFEKFDLIWAFMKKLFDDETLKSTRMKSLENIDRGYLHEFIPFIFQTLTVDQYQMIFPKFLAAAEWSNPDKFKQLLASVDAQNEFADLFYKKLFKFRDENGETIIDQAKKNEEEVLEILNKKKNEISNRMSKIQNSQE